MLHLQRKFVINLKIINNKHMKKVLLAFLMVFAISAGTLTKAAPDEGMWLPIFVEQLNYDEMQAMGLNLSAEDIYSINNSSLKDAIVNFGNFCTGEIVSPEGLILTNHHCGYEAIQSHSTIDHDYLTDGFWAMSRDEELPNEGLSATFFVRMEDVTERVLAEVTDEMTEDERSKAVKDAIKEIEDEGAEEGRYTADVKGFFNGNEYYLFIYEVFNDVRLVGAPPSSIGKYGGDTDNWMWPRHTGDFSMFRVYTAPDGSPAEYAEENVPMQSKRHLKISLDGVEENDFAMIWGYPGGTDRYRTSWGIDLTLNQINPAIDEMGDVVLSNMKEGMNMNDEVRIMYASKYAQIANLWKNKKGESRGLKRLKVYDKKKAIEDDFAKWVAANPDKQDKYGDVLKDFEEAYATIEASEMEALMWHLQLGIFGCQAFTVPFQFKKIEQILGQKMKKDELNAALEPMKDLVEAAYAEYDPYTEKLIYTNVLKKLKEVLPAENLPDIYTFIDEKFKGDICAFTDAVFETSIYASKENMLDFIAKPKLKKMEKDLATKVTNSLYGMVMQMQAASNPEADDKLKRAKRLFVAGLREMNPEKAYYPDANFTMRLTYGRVLDYYPADAIRYDYVTTLYGVMEKEDPTNDEFIVPERLKELYEAKDYGQYADKDGNMVVCFLTDNDITGGNSGSPVMNGDGELIGIAFDGNWEAMSGDIAFEPELQRTISVDIRYVLFVVDKFAGAGHLVEEMTIAE